MFFKRQMPVIIMITIGSLTLLSNFIVDGKSDTIDNITRWVNDDSLLWFGIIAAFAILLGAFNLLKIHLSKILKNSKDYPYSIFLILGFSLMIFSGFFYHGVDRLGNEQYDKGEKFIDEPNGMWTNGEYFVDIGNGKWDPAEEYEDSNKNDKYDAGEKYTDSNENGRWDPAEVYKDDSWGEHLFGKDKTLFSQLFNMTIDPLESTMFALLAFFVASASYRAFRIRNFEASLLLVSGIFVMIGAVPFGSYIPSWVFAYVFLSLLFVVISPFISDKKILWISFFVSFLIISFAMTIWYPSFLNSKSILFWILAYPTRAGKTAIMIGVALGVAATSLRIIFGKDKSFLGD